MAALMVVDHPVAVRNCLAAPQIASTHSPIDTGSRIGVDATRSTIKTSSLIERAVVPVRERLAHHKTPYVTTIKGTPALSLMRAVYPHMGALRKEGIEHALASWRGHRANWRRPAARCSASECQRPGARRGLCERHYDRWWKARRRGETTDSVRSSLQHRHSAHSARTQRWTRRVT
jgi:hypothetical protein